ncbi:MAG: hypothetical protein AABY22_28105, partial [Nanoarchaeota archaeon]
KTGFHISFFVDRKCLYLFFKKIKKFGKEAEFNSKKSDYFVALSGARNPYNRTKGFVSRTEDYRHILFLDFDNCLLRIVKYDCEYLMKNFNLTPFYIFSTEEQEKNKEKYGNYHAISLIKLSFKDVIKMQELTHSDPNHSYVAKEIRFKTWVLRNEAKGKKDKPEFKEVVGDLSKEYNQEVSNAHLNLLKKYYNIPEIKYKNLDKYDEAWLITYITGTM